MKKSFFNKNNPWKLFLLMKKTRAKKFKVRMFYHLQNLFWRAFGLGVLCPGGFCPDTFRDKVAEKFELPNGGNSSSNYYQMGSMYNVFEGRLNGTLN